MGWEILGKRAGIAVLLDGGIVSWEWLQAIPSAAGWALLAQEAPAESPFGGMMPILTMFLPMLLLWIFLIQRPQKQERQARAEMLKTLKKNDRVVTTGGIFGMVTNVQFDTQEVTIRVDETSNTKLRVQLGHVARVLGDEPAAEKESK